MLRTRVWTALVALPAVLAVLVFASDRFFALFIAALTGWGLYEIGSISAGRNPALVAMLLAAGGGSALGLLFYGAGTWLLPGAVVVAMLALVAAVALRGADAVALGPGLRTLLGALYVGVLFPYFALLRNLPEGIPITVLMLLLVVVGDSAAYFAGTRLGRIKLMPRVSPQKTVEGAIGSLAASVAAGFLLRPIFAPRWDLREMLLLSVAVNLLAQLGDLAGSALKRVSRVKDYGWLFPGHGGLLDRTCSLVFAAVFTYYYIQDAAR